MAKQPLENVVEYLFQIAVQEEFKTLNDQELLKRYVEHREELAFKELVRRYKGMIWYVCWRVLRHHQDVEDAFQATLITLIRRAKSILGRETIEGWLHRVAYHVAAKAKLMQVRRHAREERNATMRKESYERSEYGWDLAEILDKELIRIKEDYRNPMILCYLEGLTRSEAAQRLGISIDSLKWRLEQGRKQLEKRLKKYGMELGPTMLMADLSHGMHVPDLPPGLVDKTLEILRIMTLSNGVSETAAVAPRVIALAKGVMGLWTLKMKVCLGSLLLALAGMSVVVARHPSLFLKLIDWEQTQETKPDTVGKKVDEPQTNEVLPRMDLYGDPLPPGALARLGTVRFRKIPDSENKVVFTPDSKAVGLLSIGTPPRLWDIKTGKQTRQLGNSLKSLPYASSEMPVSADGRRMAYRSWGNWRQNQENNRGIHVRETATGKLIRDFAEDVYGETKGGFAISPDGAALLAATTENVKGVKSGNVLRVEHKLCLYEIATGQRIWEQKMEDKNFQGLQSLLFSPDGKLVAAGISRGDRTESKVGGVYLHNARTGHFLRTLGHPGDLENEDGTLSFSPDSRTLAVGYVNRQSQNRSVYLWDVATGEERWHLGNEKRNYKFPSFSPDGTLLAVCDHQGRIILWEVATGKELRICQQSVGVYGWSGGPLTFSPDGSVLAAAQGPMIYCWRVATGKILAHRPFGHESPVQFVAFTGDRDTLASGGFNQAVHIWDTRTANKQRTLCEEASLRPRQVFSNGWFFRPAMAVSRDGKVAAGRCLDKLLSADVTRGNFDDVISDLHCDIYLWDVVTGRELRKIKLGLPENLFLELALSPDGRYLAAWREFKGHNTILFWEVFTGRQVSEVIEGTHPEFSPDSKLLMTHKGGIFTFWETATGKKIGSTSGIVEKAETRVPLTIAPNWQILATVSEKSDEIKRRPVQKIDLYPLYWNEYSKLRLGLPHSFDCPAGQVIMSMALSPDGKMLAWADGGNSGDPKSYTVYVSETATGKERARFTGHSNRIGSLSFSPDGSRLASGSQDTTILIWDVTGGQFDGQGRLLPVQLSAQQIERLWLDMAGTDAVRAGRAIWTLAAAPEQTIPFFRKHLSPVAVEKSLEQRLEQRIAELDDPKFSVRQKAMVELAKFDETAESNLRQALEKKPSLEVRRRLLELLAVMEAKRKAPTAEMIRVSRAIEILERIGNSDARQLLKTLGQGAPGVRQTREAQAALRNLQIAKQR